MRISIKGIEEVNIEANAGAVVNAEPENPAPARRSAPKPPVKKPSTA